MAHRKIRQEYLIKQSDIKRSLKHNKDAIKTRPVASILVEDKRIPLIQFFARQYPKGVLVQVKKSNPWRLIPSSFIQTLPIAGRKAIAERKIKGEKRVGRLPITELTGPSAAGLFGSEAVIGRITDVVNDEWIAIFEGEYEFYKKAKGK